MASLLWTPGYDAELVRSRGPGADAVIVQDYEAQGWRYVGLAWLPELGLCLGFERPAKWYGPDGVEHPPEVFDAEGRGYYAISPRALTGGPDGA